MAMRVHRLRPSFDDYFMVLAKVASSRSTCNSRPTGAVIVKNKQIISTGYNGALSGIKHCAWTPENGEGKVVCYRRDIGVPDSEKHNYCKAVHAETNAVAQAAKYGISIDGAKIYCTLFPCLNCLKVIVSAGIKEIIFETDYISLDKKRDIFVKKQAEEAEIVVRPFKLDKRALQVVIESLVLHPTSNRRMPATK